MEKHISLDLFNYGRKKLCNLYDSQLNAKGQAYNIIYTDSIQGDKT